MAKENVYESALQSLVISPKTTKTQAFIYRGVNDLENLVRFLGVAPKVIFEKGKMNYQFGKVIVPDNSLITRSVYGDIILCLTLEQANERFDIVAQRDYDKVKDSQNVIPKEKKTRTPKK